MFICSIIFPFRDEEIFVFLSFIGGGGGGGGGSTWEFNIGAVGT